MCKSFFQKTSAVTYLSSHWAPGNLMVMLVRGEANEYYRVHLKTSLRNFTYVQKK